MRWRQLRLGYWALEGLRIKQKAANDFEVYPAQVELPLGQSPIKSAHFTTLKSAKDYGKRRHEGTG